MMSGTGSENNPQIAQAMFYRSEVHKIPKSFKFNETLQSKIFLIEDFEFTIRQDRNQPKPVAHPYL